MVRMIKSFVALLYIAQLYGIDAIVKVQHKTLNFTGQEVVFGFESHQDAKLTYATCSSNDATRERICKVVRERTPFTNDTYSCDVTLKIEQRHGIHGITSDKVGLIPFGTNRAVLYLAEKVWTGYVKLITINFDDCKLATTELLVENSSHKPSLSVVIVPYDDSYDIIYQNSTDVSVDGDCQITIDKDGKITNGPNKLMHNPYQVAYYPFVLALDPRNRSLGAFHMQHVPHTSRKYEFLIRKPGGLEKSLGVHKTYKPVSKSTANEFIGVCYNSERLVSNITCTQYDDNGNVKFEINPLSGDNTTEVALVHNLPGGGLLLLAAKCTNKSDCELNEYQFLVMKIDSNGNKVGTLNIGPMKFEFASEDVKIVRLFYVNEDKEYCLSLASFHSTDTGSYTDGYIEKSDYCFTDTDFSK